MFTVLDKNTVASILIVYIYRYVVHNKEIINIFFTTGKLHTVHPQSIFA